MRNRLAACFVLVALCVLAVFVGVRLGSLHGLIRDEEAGHLEHDAGVLARTVERSAGTDRPLDPRGIAGLLEPDVQASVAVQHQRVLTVTGADFDVDADHRDQLRAAATSGATSVELRRSSASVRSVFVGAVGPVVTLGGLLVLLAGLIGYLAASLLAAPFSRLADAADALSRGRFDLDLPRSRIPEAGALARSLELSAARLRRQVKRDQEFLEDASHRLRTPMAGLRLELEELAGGELDTTTRATLARSIQGLDHLEELTSDVFALARAGRAGFEEVTLEQLAQQTAQSWSTTLAERQLRVRACVDGALEQPLTPGPLEQVLDALLADLLQSAGGEVSLSFVGAPEQVTIRVCADPRRPDPPARRAGLETVHQLVEALAGRCAGDPVADGIRIWLPSR